MLFSGDCNDRATRHSNTGITKLVPGSRATPRDSLAYSSERGVQHHLHNLDLETLTMDPLSAASTVAGMVILGGKLTVASHAFTEKVKDCPRRVKNIESDLRSITQILQKLEKSLSQPTNAGVFSLKDKRQEFESVIEGLREVFEELGELIKKYEGLNGIGGLWKRTKWASVGVEEATQLGRLLAAQKGTLSITLALTHGYLIFPTSKTPKGFVCG